jgi:hypothetical protein
LVRLHVVNDAVVLRGDAAQVLVARRFSAALPHVVGVVGEDGELRSLGVRPAVDRELQNEEVEATACLVRNFGKLKRPLGIRFSIDMADDRLGLVAGFHDESVRRRIEALIDVCAECVELRLRSRELLPNRS